MMNHDREAELGMTLARRAYLYSLLHVVFGGDPSEKTVASLFGAQTCDMVDALAEELASERFALVASRTLSQDAPALSVCLQRAAAGLREASVAVAEDPAAFVEGLRSDYNKLFLVSGGSHVHLWESSYLGGDLMLFQESTLDVRSFYHAAGFKLQAERKFPDDHIAAMMDFMGRMGQRAYEAFADGSDAEAADALVASHDFAESHILTWVDDFAADVVEKDPRGYYAAFACVMAVLAHVDAMQSVELSAEIRG